MMRHNRPNPSSYPSTRRSLSDLYPRASSSIPDSWVHTPFL